MEENKKDKRGEVEMVAGVVMIIISNKVGSQAGRSLAGNMSIDLTIIIWLFCNDSDFPF
jgi:hypothetical protein